MDPDREAVDALTRTCRNCGAPLERLFVDLGMSPPCEDFRAEDRLPSPRRSTRSTSASVTVPASSSCRRISRQEIFTEYAYFSSYSRHLGRARRRLGR